MPFPNKATQFKPGQSGNPNGLKKGTKHISAWIQDMLEDEDFETFLQHPKKGYVEFKGAPLKAIIQTAITKAVAGDDKARDWLAKYGWKQQIDITSNDETIVPVSDPTLAAEFAEFLKSKR